MSVVLRVPLPPPSLRANSRSHWAKKKQDADAYSRAVYGWTMGELDHVYRDQNPPWDAASIHYEWHYAGTEPDLGNIPGNVKYLQDILCMAPKNGAGPNRFYLGLVDNDRNITPSYSLIKEKRRAAECVAITIDAVLGIPQRQQWQAHDHGGLRHEHFTNGEHDHRVSA